MPQFLSPEWVAAFDAALAGVKVPGPGEDAGLAALDGDFTVLQEVHGGPTGDLTVALTVSDGSLHLSLPVGEPSGAEAADVAISLSYEDAVALSKGELVAAQALTEGRVRVRGDLSVLVASQQMLASAQPYVQALAADTTY
ncbi:MAG TPA: SCP2 sterol-binding domain-containing protein [Acidimicrobiales bacterium]|nr:SCP2 sterol-binding domain-containing protein [Acidimicrobiales bacterium]